MSTPIPYTVQSGETLQDIAKKLGIKDWTKLRDYHNNRSATNQQTNNIPFTGFNLLTPTKEEIYEMNGETPPPDPVEEQKNAEQKQSEEKKKEEEQKKDEKVSKSDHDGKYFVVKNAKCVCDKAENPKQTADLQVTTHKIIVLNDNSDKLAATEEDNTFMPPVATFGKCTLKPSAAGNLPCALAAAPKWSKTYDSTQVMGKNTLTEISELQCMVGGKITIDKHGQTDSVSNAHADNTNPLELAAVNPAIEQPKKKEEYPVVTSISLTKIEDRKDFKEVDSKNQKDIVYLRKNEETDFKANLKSGNKQLTSWMVYSDHQGKKENRILLKEQIGIEFSQSFADLGKFKIEGYGKPKSPDFEKGKYDKCDPTCSINVEVVENTLLDIECTSGDFSTRLDPSKNRKFRRGVPSVFKAKFFIPTLNEDEKSRLTLSLLDGSGNTVTDAVQNGETLTFTPQNTQAKYTIVARYTNEKGEVIEKQMSGETEGNAVIGISHGAEVVRPGTAMSFSVSKMKYNFANNPLYDLTSDESSEIKWNLNGVLIGTGKSITVSGNQLMAPGKYVVEAYSKVANATGKGFKDEDDDWRFEVKENDIVSFSLSGTPKVGKPLVATVDKMIFADLLPNEIVHWKSTLLSGIGKSIKTTPKVEGTFTISCAINNSTGIQQDIKVVQAKITKGFWNDFEGNEISKASWGQKVDFCVKGQNIDGEDIELAIYDSDNMSGDDFGYSNTENKLKITGKNDQTYASHRIELVKKIKDRTTNTISSEAQLYGKARLLGFENSTLKDVTPLEKTSKHLIVNNGKSVYRAIIGDQNGRARHNPVDYDIKSWVYSNTTYPKGTKLTVKIFEKKGLFEKDVEAKELLNTGTVKEDGTLVTEINWNKLKDAKQNKKTKTYYASIYDEKDNRLLDGSDAVTLCNAILIPQSVLRKEASYVGAVIVGNETINTVQSNSACICKDYDLLWGKKFTCDERKKVVQICSELWGEAKKKEMANQLMICMALETGEEFKTNTGYSSGGATGLVQWTGTAIDAMNKNNKYNDGITLTKKALSEMTVIRQLDFVKLYFKMWMDSGKVINDSLDLYMCIWCPAAVGKEDSFVCYSEKDSSKYYNANKSIDGEYYREKYINSKGKKVYNTVGQGAQDEKITKGELRPRLKVKEVAGKGYKARIFTCNFGKTPLNAKDIITYHIYNNGKIEKHIPKTIKDEYKNKYKYIYHDAKKGEHLLGIGTFTTINNKHGADYGGKTVDLIDIKQFPSYSSGDVKYKIMTWNSGGGQRYYLNDKTLAAFLGALLNCGFEDIVFNGFSNSEGGSGVSKTHYNGYNGDIRYLCKDKSGSNLHLDVESKTNGIYGWKDMDKEREITLINALYLFGWSKFYSWEFNDELLPYSTELKDHNHHLHMYSFEPNYEEINEK